MRRRNEDSWAREIRNYISNFAKGIRNYSREIITGLTAVAILGGGTAGLAMDSGPQSEEKKASYERLRKDIEEYGNIAKSAIISLLRKNALEYYRHVREGEVTEKETEKIKSQASSLVGKTDEIRTGIKKKIGAYKQKLGEDGLTDEEKKKYQSLVDSLEDWEVTLSQTKTRNGTPFWNGQVAEVVDEGEREFVFKKGKRKFKYKFIDDSSGVRPLEAPQHPSRYSQGTFYHNQRRLREEGEELFESYESQDSISLPHKTVDELRNMKKKDRDDYISRVERALRRREYEELYKNTEGREEFLHDFVRERATSLEHAMLMQKLEQNEELIQNIGEYEMLRLAVRSLHVSRYFPVFSKYFDKFMDLKGVDGFEDLPHLSRDKLRQREMEVSLTPN